MNQVRDKVWHLTEAQSTNGLSLGAGGFIHLCWPWQADDVIRRFFRGRPVWVVELDVAALDPEKLREEDSYGHGMYPHYYGEISKDAVSRVFRMD